MSTTNGSGVTIAFPDKPRTLKYRFDDALELKRRCNGQTPVQIVANVAQSDPETIQHCLMVGFRHEDKKLGRDWEEGSKLVQAYLDADHDLSDFIPPILDALKAGRIIPKTSIEKREETTENP
jgi:hypothetical protein